MACKQVKDTQELLRVFMIMFEQFSSYVCAFGKNKNDILPPIALTKKNNVKTKK